MPSQILLASNDEMVGQLVVRVLTSAGYCVTTVRTGTAAVAALLAGKVEFDLAIMDSQLPPVAGNHVVAELREHGCQVPVILASGSFIAQGLPMNDPHVALLSKPFRPSDLLMLVESLMGDS